MDAENTRRRFLELAGVSAGALLAGCSGDGGSGSTPTDAAETDATDAAPATTAETETDIATETQTETETPQQMSTVFHFAKAGESNQERALSNVRNLLETDMVDMESIVLVANSKGIHLLTKEGAHYPDEVQSLTDAGVSFRVCANTMEGIGITESDLLDGVEVVPAGVGELTKLQTEGYAYIETP